MPSQANARLTVEEYLTIERQALCKSEYFNGEMFAMAGASRRHNLIVLNIGAELRAQLPAYIDVTARLYVRHFTLEEMNQLIAFYQTPIGQKMLAKLPSLTRESMQIGQLWGQRAAREAFEKFVPVLKKNGLKSPAI